MSGHQSYETLDVRVEQSVCFIRMSRPECDNAINDTLVREMRRALAACGESINVVVVEGLPRAFCVGADIEAARRSGERMPDVGPLYALWLELANAPAVTVAHVQGRVNAGGVGFVAACDVVLCDERVEFSLSELLFGLVPACVLPFLIRRVGPARANYLTLLTKPISAEKALEWGLVDACASPSDELLRQHLLRLRALPRAGVVRYKRYRQTLDEGLTKVQSEAIRVSREAFSDPDNLARIDRHLRQAEPSAARRSEPAERGPDPAPATGGRQREILERIVRYTREVVPTLRSQRLSPQDSLRELGVNSIERAEILIMTLESLSLRIPLVEFSRAENIGGLAEVIHAKSP